MSTLPPPPAPAARPESVVCPACARKTLLPDAHCASPSCPWVVCDACGRSTNGRSSIAPKAAA